MTRHISLLASPCLVAAVCWFAGPASAQQQVNTGNALDANLQVGSGGNVPAAQIPDFRARNLLITGQVTDGRQFRGDAGYSAAGAFGGQLGSDDLFRFRADAVGSTRQLSPLGIYGGANLGNVAPNLGGGTVIYNNYFTPNADGDVAGPGAVRTVISPDGSRAALVSTGTVYNPEFVGVGNLNAAATDQRRDARLAYTANTLGRATDSEGRTLQVDADPLFGIRETAINPDTVGTVEDPPGYVTGQRSDERFGPGTRQNYDDRPGLDRLDQRPDHQDLNRTDPRNADERQALNQPFGDTLGQTVGNRNTARGAALNTRRSNGNAGLAPGAGTALTSNSAVDPAAAANPASDQALSLQLGARLNPTLAALNPANQSATAAAQDAQRVDRIGESIFRPLDSTAAAPGDNAYLDLLQQIRDEHDARNAQANQGNQANPGDRPDGPAKPQWMEKLDDPTDDAIRRAEENSRSAIASILRAQQQDAARDGRPIGAEPTEQEAATTAAMTNLLDQLAYELPRLETLQGQRQDRANRNFGLAEEAMANGRYFDAVKYYEQLRRDAPGNPLARVGLIHAQLGAGLIRSAELNLRDLFEQHPELIATRYAENLLPPEERFVWLREQMQQRIDDPQSGNLEAGVMLAYMGHQIESRQLVRYGLAVATEAKPTDPLLPLLRGVWLGEQPEK